MDRSVELKDLGTKLDMYRGYTPSPADSLRTWQQVSALRRQLHQLRRMARRWLPLALGSGGLSIPWLAMPSPVQAQLSICSRKINRHLDVAIGYPKEGQWVSEGWWKLPPSGCVTPLQGDLRNRYYYIRGVETNTGKTWSQNYAFCTDSSAFTIYGDENCESRGYQKENFFQYDCGGNKFCNIIFWPEKVSFGPSPMDKIIARQQQDMQNIPPLPSSELIATITP